MTQTLDSKKVIESLQSILTELEKLRLESLDKEKLNKTAKNFSYSHCYHGSAFAYKNSYSLLKHFLNTLLFEK